MYTGEAGAIRERRKADTRYAIGYFHTREAVAIRERPTVDTRYAIRYNKLCYKFSVEI